MKHIFSILWLLPLFCAAQKKDRYFEKVKSETADLQVIFDYILKNNLHEGFARKTIWLDEKVFKKEKLIRQHFNKLHIKEVVIQGKTGYKSIAPEDSVIILKRKYYTPGSVKHEVIYDASGSGKKYPDVVTEQISFLALADRMYYLKR